MKYGYGFAGRALMERLLYVSESKIKKADFETVVAGIVAKSVDWNTEHNLTGALIFTGTHFAQVLEGSQKDIDEVMSIITSDPRHGSIRVVDRSSITERQFPNWAMAYQGPSQFVSRHVTRLLNATSGLEKRRATDWLIQLAHEFVIYKG